MRRYIGISNDIGGRGYVLCVVVALHSLNLCGCGTMLGVLTATCLIAWAFLSREVRGAAKSTTARNET